MAILAPSAGPHHPSFQTAPKVPPARTGRIFDIKRFSGHDGPGIRSTVFFTGCPLRCAWCHNPEALVCGGELAGRQVREVTVPSLVREVERDVSYYDASGGGVTVSGGEPLVQAAFVLEFLRACRARELHTAVDTSGAVDPAVLREAALVADLLLYDLKSMDAGVHREWTGAGNQLILDNLRMLDALPAAVWIRLPLIPGVNDGEANLEAVMELLRGTRFRRVSLLPYHKIAAAKYQRLGLPNRMEGVEPPPPDQIERARDRFAAGGFEPHIGS